MVRISKWVVLITFCVSVIVAGLTIYADNVGNFIVTISNSDGSMLMLSEKEDFKDGGIIIFGPSLQGMTHATYINIPQENLLNKDGDHSNTYERTYFAYSFYLTNIAATPVDYEVELNINESYRGVDEAVRIQLLKCDKDEQGNWQAANNNIYAKREADGTMYDNSQKTAMNPRPYVTQPFYNTNTGLDTAYTAIFQKEMQFGVNEIHKYVAVMWLEGNDPNCNDDILKGALRMSILFNVVGTY